MDAALVLVALALFQDPAGQEPNKPVVVVPGESKVEPKPEYPPSDNIAFRTIFLRPKFELTTREFDINKISEPMDFGDLADYDRTAIALDLRWDTGAWSFMATYFRMEGHTVLGEAARFEQHDFAPGTEVEGTTQYGTVEAYYRFNLAGGAEETGELSFLLGLNFTRYFLSLSDGDRTGSEGFSALWPVPAIGLEGRVWLSSRLAISASARATRLQFENPFQVDAGSAQVMRLISGRLDAGFQWAVSDSITLTAGYSGFSTSIDDASVEDTDSADLRASGVQAGLMFRY